MNNADKYLVLREKHPVFVYDSLDIHAHPGRLSLKYTFLLENGPVFQPLLHFDIPGFQPKQLPEAALFNLAFHLGMVEMISYWKAACSPRILLRPAQLTAQQAAWWKKLFRFGLGEFYYTNGIPMPGEEMLQFDHGPEAKPSLPSAHLTLDGQSVLVPVGGGKDSVVSLELLKNSGFCMYSLVVNPLAANQGVIDGVGVAPGRQIRVDRRMDTALLDLNAQGYLNGHTPFSALLAFISSLAAAAGGIRHMALSNESSANEPNIPQTNVNHQYSKSLEFEAGFRQYARDFLSGDLNYFSFLRPLNELQIGALFSRLKTHHPVFRSCNAGSKTGSWCGQCPKCLFTWIALSPFMEQKALQQIFGSDLLEKEELLPTLKQLCGMDSHKPFECVGTYQEVNLALAHLVRKMEADEMELPALLKTYREGPLFSRYASLPINDSLHSWSRAHFLPRCFEDILAAAKKKAPVP